MRCTPNFVSGARNFNEIFTRCKYSSARFRGNIGLNESSYRRFSISNANLLRLSYVSSAAPAITQAEVTTIVNEASVRNRALGISGVLAFYKGKFFQCLEGKAETVKLLLQAIELDQRHSNVQVLSCEPTKNRRFAQWGMADAHTLIGDDALPSLAQLFDREELGHL